MNAKSLSIQILTRAIATATIAICAVPGAYATETEIKIPTPFPESLTVTSDGTFFAGSMTHGGIVRVLPGASEAEVWIKPGAFDTRSTFGVLADEPNGMLWVCSNDATPIGVKGPSTVEGSFVKGFDLKSGEGKVSVQLPATPSICNDLVIGPDGALYVSNTLQPQILRLKKDASKPEVWAQDDRLKGGLDGLAFGRDGNLYANTFMSGELFRIEPEGDRAGAITKIETSRPLKFPDGLKADGAGFLMVEGAGPLSRVTINGNKARVETIKEFAGPAGVARIGDTVWVSEGQIGFLMDPAKKGQTPSFQLRSVSLPRQ